MDDPLIQAGARLYCEAVESRMAGDDGRAAIQYLLAGIAYRIGGGRDDLVSDCYSTAIVLGRRAGIDHAAAD